MTDSDNPSVLEVVSPGMGVTVQDGGRIGWRKFGVPMGGAMDDHAARAANVLVDNPADAPVLEMLMQGQRFRVHQQCWLAVTGADASSTIPVWHAEKILVGSEIVFPSNRNGVWIYLAIAGGFDAEQFFGSYSASVRAGLGEPIRSGQVLRRSIDRRLVMPDSIGSRGAPWDEQRDYLNPPTLRVWQGPQWDAIDEDARASFFEQEWTVSSQSDRVGYRLSGDAINPPKGELISEPVRIGSVQIPANGQPIITLRDGPTVGGYPKLGMVDPRDISWLVQCRPNQKVRFRPYEA
jgi:5-oxoprolinase (ATP-hydrolysing) subunit C